MEKNREERIKQLDETIKNLKDMIEVILLAIPRERDALLYYKNAYLKAKSKASKDIFSYLIEQEKSHEEVLKKRLEEIQQEIIDTELEIMKLKGERGG